MQLGAGPVRVKLRRTQCEQMSSELPLKADIAQYSRHISKVPLSDFGAAWYAPSHRAQNTWEAPDEWDHRVFDPGSGVHVCFRGVVADAAATSGVGLPCQSSGFQTPARRRHSAPDAQ